MHKVLITGAIHPIGLEILGSQSDIHVDYRPDLPQAEILKIIAGYDCILSRSETAVGPPLIDAATNLKVVSRAAVGVGNIDINYATERGILVLNTPGQNTNSAAELTFGLLIALMRHIIPAHKKLESLGWERHTFLGAELLNKSIGIVGLGNVGHRVARFARGFEMEVFAFDPYISDEIFRRHEATKCETLRELLSKVDILSVHVPKNKETTGMIGAEELAQLKAGALVLNAARGGIVDEGALLRALESGHIGGAGIDTFEVEPPGDHPFISMSNVVMTPHIGATTEEAQRRIGRSVALQTIKALRGEVVDTPVNMPHLQAALTPELKRYSVLAERLGSFTGQFIDFNPSDLRFIYRGLLTTESAALIRLAFLKGFLNRTVDDDVHVSFVNVESLVESRGIGIVEEDDPSFEAYRSALRVVVSSEGKDFRIGGTVFDEAHARFTYLDGFSLEMEPRGHFLVVRNQDRPGIIGHIGMTLGRGGVNIDAFELSRRSKGGIAMALVRIDEPAADGIIDELRRMDGILRVHAIEL